MSWQPAVAAASLAEPKTAVPVRVEGTGLLITRDEHGTVRAFENQCPHQAATVCRESQVGAATVECPNHFWVFGLDGTFQGSRIALASGRTAPPDPEKNLREFPCRVIGATVEVNLAADR